MENKFYVGQEVLCIKTHPNGVVVRWNKYTVMGIRRSRCPACGILLDVGITEGFPEDMGMASHCEHGLDHRPYDNIWWLGSFRFIPIDNTLSETTSDEVLEIMNDTHPFKVEI